MKTLVALVLSGTGSDANAVMQAHLKTQLDPDLEIDSVISTVEGAKGIENAKKLGFHTTTIARKGRKLAEFQAEFREYILSRGIKVVFLLGCIHPVPEIEGVEIFNIHPAHPIWHGGKRYYSLEPHRSVLREIVRLVFVDGESPNGPFFTEPTFHAVIAEYDRGQPLMRLELQIPKSIIDNALNPATFEQAATDLQQMVLPSEHLMLPAAVNLVMRQRKVLGIS